MNKLALLPLVVLAACAAPGENARPTQAALDHDKAVCVAGSEQVGTDGYTLCMAKLGHKQEYVLADADDRNVELATCSVLPLDRVACAK
jgi:hypothetical protein